MLPHKKTNLILLFSLLLLTAALQPSGIIPVTAGNSYAPDYENALPSLSAFIDTVTTGAADTLAGVYVEGLFALPVIQQPVNQPGYVSTRPETITQFRMAESFGTIGLLAHNFESGRQFFDLEENTEVILVYGDGSLSRFLVSWSARYQAIQPDNPQSAFRDLSTNELLSAADLFSEVYQNPGTVTFQTCIAQGNSASWGRLFVNAVPAVETESDLSFAYAELDEAFSNQ